MNVVTRPSMTREEFLLWAEAQEKPYEFDGRKPVLMTGGNLVSNQLFVRLLLLLAPQLNGSRFEPIGPNYGVATVGSAIRFPDVVVIPAGGDKKGKLADGPIVVFEVVSPTSGKRDRVIKVQEYGAVLSIRRYVVVEQDFMALTVHEKSGAEPWRTTVLTEGVLDMPEISACLDVATLYDGLGIPSADPAEG